MTPWIVAHQVPQSMGFSTQEYWSGLPCPPPRDLPSPGIKPRPPTLHADSLPAESQGKPKNTGVGSLSLLKGIFPTQGSNPGLQHCRQILYHLSHHNLLRNITHHSTPNIFFYQCDGCFIKNTIISFKLG